MTRAKSWCKLHRSSNIEDKFSWEEDKDKRVYIPEFYMLKSDLKYLNRLAKRRGISPSACLEKMVDRCILKGWDPLYCYTMKGKRRKRSTSSLCEEKVKRRKYKIHPAMLMIVERAKEENGGMSYSLFFECVISEYKSAFPLR
jgi:hypothetical protein